MTSIVRIFLNAIREESLTTPECIIFLLCIIIILLVVIVCQLHNSNGKQYLMHSLIKQNADNQKKVGE